MADANGRGGSVEGHYGAGGDLTARIVDWLRATGRDPDAPSLDDLAPVDQFHLGGREATRELARLAGIAPTMRVLDVGGGIGGPARTLASEFGCAVTVLDLTEAFCRAGAELTARTGLGDRVAFRHGDAQAMPFADASFGLVWTQHSSMNIPDKERLYREIGRVLRPGGRLALHEIMAGPVQPLHFPVFWASEPGISFLRPPAEIRSLLRELGFVEDAWIDKTEAVKAWFQAVAARPAPAPGTPELHLVAADDFAERRRNVRRNVEEGRIVVVAAVLDRPA